MFYRRGLLAPCLTTTLVDRIYMSFPSPVSANLCPPETGWPSYIPRHWVPILVASYDTHGVRWGYSNSQPPHGKLVTLTVPYVTNVPPYVDIGGHFVSGGGHV
jgi:hypothetical protein